MVGQLEKIILEFLEAENERCWQNYEKFLSENVQWTFFSTEGTRIVKGKKNYVETMKKIYEKVSSTFDIISILSDDELGIVMAELEMDNRRSVDVFELQNGLILREREYYDGVYWQDQLKQKHIFLIDIKIESKMLEAIKLIASFLSSNENWAIDGSASLALQGIDLKPNDIDVLTDENGAYEIQTLLSDYLETPVRHISNDKYDSHFGTVVINEIRVEIMGDLRVFREDRWSDPQNPRNCNIKVVNLEGIRVPVVSLESQISTGYLLERVRRNKDNLE